jgi:hypothetical protein
MNRPTPVHEHDDVDRILDAHLSAPTERLEPSSGFALSVMESIHAQAAVPSPIAFPWRRTLPGIVAAACGLIALIAFIIHAWIVAPAVSQTSKLALPQALHALYLSQGMTQGGAMLGWILFAACLAAAAAAAAFRLAGASR